MQKHKLLLPPRAVCLSVRVVEVVCGAPVSWHVTYLASIRLVAAATAAADAPADE